MYLLNNFLHRLTVSTATGKYKAPPFEGKYKPFGAIAPGTSQSMALPDLLALQASDCFLAAVCMTTAHYSLHMEHFLCGIITAAMANEVG